MDLKDQQSMQAELELMRLKINTEVGTEPNCPWCGVPRVSRSSYIRCNRCGVNWSRGTDYSKDPRVRIITSPSKSAGDSKADARPYIPYDPKKGMPSRNADGEWEQAGNKL